MAFLDSGQNTLEDALRGIATDKSNSISDIYAKKRRQAVSQQAASGRLGSGVSNYQFGDLASQEAADQGNVYGDLASTLAQVPIQDYGVTQDNLRKRQLAELLASLNKPSSLEEALGTLGSFGNLAGSAAAISGAL